MLGQALHRHFDSSFDVFALGRPDLDITSLDKVHESIGRIKPHWIINAAAYTAVDLAESETLSAYRVNALGCRNLAVAADEAGCRLVSYSTDYVFDGTSQRAYREWDPTNPINEYGRTKMIGEEMIRSFCPRNLIIRTSWLFGEGGSHFVDNIQARAKGQDRISVVSDQRGAPTYTADLAEMTAILIERGLVGTYHVTNSGDCSWHEFASKIFELKGIDITVEPVSTESFPTPAKRPKNSVLENFNLKLEGIPPLRRWQTALSEFLGSE